MTNPEFSHSETAPAEPEAPTEDTALQYPEDVEVDVTDPNTRPANAPEHHQDGSYAG